MNKIRIAVVGCGRRGRDMARSALASEDLKLVCVCDNNEERLHAAGAAHGPDMWIEQHFKGRRA